MRKEKSVSADKNEILSLLHSFDPDSCGTLSRQSLTQILTSTGEPFTPSELEELFTLLQDTQRSTDIYDYTKMSAKISDTCAETMSKYKITKSDASLKSSSGRKKVNEKTIDKLKSKIQPSNLCDWSQVSQCGFLRYEDKTMMSTAFKMSLSSSTQVFITAQTRNIVHVPKKDVQIMVLCVKTDQSGSLSQPAYLSDLYDGASFSLKVDLPPGNYLVIPFTMSTNFLPRKQQPKSCSFVQLGSVDSSSGDLSEECEAAIETLFELIDVDGDGTVNRSELDLFQLICTGEQFEEEDWKALSEMWETVDNCITQRGFKEMNGMEAREDPEELWNSFSKMGFNSALQLDECCPLKLTFHSHKSDVMQIAAHTKSTSFKQIECALIDLVLKQADKKCVKTKSIEEVDITTFQQNQVGFIGVQNAAKRSHRVRLDLSKCSNVHLASEFKDLLVGEQSKKVVQLLTPTDPSEKMVVKMAAEIRT